MRLEGSKLASKLALDKLLSPSYMLGESSQKEKEGNTEMAKNTHKVTTIKTDGSVNVSYCNSKTEYETLSKAVRGYIETLHLFDSYEGKKCRAYCNEEGRLHRLPFNEKASHLWLDGVPTNSKNRVDFGRMQLVGDIAIIQKL